MALVTKAPSVRIEKAIPSRHTKQQTKTKSRTSNACEACKRRKTKCTGSPSPCDVCVKAETYCCFNPKLDTRRKVAYTSSNVQDRQQFMITALLQTIKHTSEDDLQQLIRKIRGPPRPDDVAVCLRKHFDTLQAKNLIPKMAFDNTDVISFALQGLCGHRKGRPRPAKSEDDSDLLSPTSQASLASESNTSSGSNTDFLDDEIGDKNTASANTSMNMDDKGDGDFDIKPSGMFDIAVAEAQHQSTMDNLDRDRSMAMGGLPMYNSQMDFGDGCALPFSATSGSFDETMFSGIDTTMPTMYPPWPSAPHHNMQSYLNSQSLIAAASSRHTTSASRNV
ncbi:uncharacterized protein AB675_10428 [Cyphellophora attinorum]|uniref:Zn(2)-C6 fungal-type domain-containing protein n=1 Tax=Cyphellophora attinorum TaxID=1664694 RepID=A0A0N0NIX6_9EURO|nr:uncharacterized protein AB675_10428 [Phialophora attinorum]KPI35959.1 hypothetical protein AB675_10428 [Phialophora attinorum]